MSACVLVVDNDALVRTSIAHLLRDDGYEAIACASGDEALEVLRRREEDGAPVDAVISDVSMPGMSGTDLLRVIRERFEGTGVVLLTGYATMESAVEAMRLGACDYLAKPVVDEELRCALARALRESALARENLRLRRRLDDRSALSRLIGQDPRMRRVHELVEAVAPSRTTVLMCGESGTGKTLVARAIHERSDRADGPFIDLACGSIPESLLESELFGHVRGAFTGAVCDKAGKFLAANGGTLFLDEINSASAAMQLKLLRVIQDRRFEPVGSNETIEVDVRLVLASNQELEDLVAAGEFREDLYYRINVVRIDLPPLRERLGDVPLLAERFLARICDELGRTIVGFSDEAMAALMAYTYPGNVRELENLIERAAVLCRGQTIGLEDLPGHVIGSDERPAGVRGAAGGSLWNRRPLVEALREPERRIIEEALAANGWNRSRTAEALGINRTTLYKKMRQLGIDLPA